MDRIPADPLVVKGLQIAEILLGVEVLAARLGSPVSLIRAWRMGHASMPQAKFLQLVDILVDIDPGWADK